MSRAPDSSKLDLWVEERHRNISAVRFRVRGLLFSETSAFQTVEIVDTFGFGRMLLNDGLIMLSERDEFIYHDMIAHVPLFAHPDPKRILIIGGGDGGTAREVLRHRGVERCHMVEIDETVVRACREHLPLTASALDDPRLEVIIDDGVAFVGKTDLRFDVVIVDSTDPIGPAQPLFGEAFYGDVRRVLEEGGIVVSQAESPHHEEATQASLAGILGRLFRETHFYNFSNLTYPGGLWSFSFASDAVHPVRDFDPGRVTGSGLEFRYYNEAVHTGAFALPTFMRNRIAASLAAARG